MFDATDHVQPVESDVPLAESAPKKEKKPDFDIQGSFSVRIKENTFKRPLEKVVRYQASHVRNMILILRQRLYEKSLTDTRVTPVLNAFSNKVIMRSTIHGSAGGKKKEQVALIREYFKNDTLFKALCEYAQEKLDAKTTFAILGAIDASYSQFYTNIAAYKANPSAYATKFGNNGAPRPPKSKKLKLISNASIKVDSEKWGLFEKEILVNGCKVRRRGIAITLGKRKRLYIPCDTSKFPLPKGKTLRSLDVNVSNDAVYFNFTYGVEVKPNTNKEKPTLVSDEKTPVWAAADVGMENILSIFTATQASDSLLVCGKRFKHYNVRFNKHKAQISEAIAKEVTETKEIERDFIDSKTGKRVQDKITVPVSYTKQGQRLRKQRTHMIEKRNRFFDSEFDKLSTRVVELLMAQGVTHFVMSKNLSFLKTSDKQVSKLTKKTKQQFYHLPFGKLLTHIERKCQLVGIYTRCIDEAYTSQVACFSGDVRTAKQRRLAQDNKLSTNDCQGSRVQRGLYRDGVVKRDYLFFNADINAAINHIKLAVSSFDSLPWKAIKHKLCNPVKIKSDYCFYLFNQIAV